MFFPVRDEAVARSGAARSAAIIPLLLLFLLIPSSEARSEDETSDGARAVPFPELGLIGDFVFSYGEEDAREAGADGFLLRSVELGVHGEVDRLLDYHAIVFFDEEEVELEEAYVRADDWLPEHLGLRAGRFNLDFGQQSPLHDHDLATLDKPAALQELIGGTLRGTGVELGWWTPVRERGRFRLGAAVLQSADSDAHAVLGPAAGHAHGDEEEDEEGPIRDVEDFAVNLRASSVLELSPSSAVELGASFLHAPTRVFGLDETDERDLDQQVLGLDLGYDGTDPESGRGLRLLGEWLHRDADQGELDDGGTPGDPTDDLFFVSAERAQGATLLAEFRTGRQFAVGASGSWYEHIEDADETSHDIGVFATWWPTATQRLRFEVRSFADLAVEEDDVERSLDFVAFSVQWTIELGTHGHDHAFGLDLGTGHAPHAGPAVGDDHSGHDH